MNKASIHPLPAYFDRYINLVPEDHLGEALRNSMTALEQIDINLLSRIGSKVYEPGKWTVKDILQHLIDSERVFAYRALRFARNDKTVLPGFDENTFADNASAELRSLEVILAELEAARTSTRFMFESLDIDRLMRSGTCNGKEISVLGLGFTIVGHQIHHLNVINERYAGLA